MASNISVSPKILNFISVQDDLKNKDIKLLIENNSKLLEKYEKQIPTTIDEVIKRVKTIFTYFTKNQYLPHNIFNDIENHITGKEISTDSFTEVAAKIVDKLNDYLWSGVELAGLLAIDGSSEVHDILYNLLNALENLSEGEPLTLYANEIQGYINELKR